MTTLYFAQTVDEDGNDTTTAYATQNDAKAAAKEAYGVTKNPKKVVKVELAKIGSRELMCALFNGETGAFTGSKETIWTAGPRSKKATDESAEEENPYDI